MADIAELGRTLTLAAAVTRLEALRIRGSLVDPENPARSPTADPERVARTARPPGGRRPQGRLRAAAHGAHCAGSSWSEIGQALGASRQAAGEARQRRIDGQAGHRGRIGEIGFDRAQADAARAPA